MMRRKIAAPIRTSATRSTMPMLPDECPRSIGALGASSAAIASTSSARPPFWAASAAPICPIIPAFRKRTPANDRLTPERAPQAEYVADHFGHRLIMLRRDFLVDLDAVVERAGERRVFHHR